MTGSSEAQCVEAVSTVTLEKGQRAKGRDRQTSQMVGEGGQDNSKCCQQTANEKGRELPVSFRAGSKHSQCDKFVFQANALTSDDGQLQSADEIPVDPSQFQRIR